MADVIVDNLLLEIKIRMTALEQGLAAAEDRIDQFTGNTKNAAKQQAAAVKASAQEQSMAYTATGAAAAAAFAVIVSAISKGIQAANQYTSALVGLRSIAEGTGQNFGEMQTALDDLTADGLIPVSNAATAFKNLLSRGFDAQQAVDMLNRLKDSAAFGRQASLSLGDAVQSAAEGLKNENSVLVDNAGVTKNVAKMWEDYAKQLGKSTNDLTLAEKRQAEYNGIMQETRFQVGDAAKYTAEFAGTQAELNAATLQQEQAFGRAAQSGLQPFLEMLTPVVRGVGEYVDQNPSFIAAITAGGTSMLGFVAILGVAKTAIDLLKTAFAGMGAALGWAGIAAIVISALVGIASAANEAAKSTAKAATEMQDSINASREEQATLRGYQELVASGKATHEELAAAREKIIQQSPELVAGYDAEGNAILADSDAIKLKIGQLQEYIDMQEEALRASAGATLADAAEQQKKAIQDQQEAIINYKKELESLANLSAQKSAMKAAGVGMMEFDGQLVYLDEVETALLGVQDRLKKYKQDWADALHSQQEAESAAAATNALLMQDQINSLGLVSEAQHLAAEETMQYALENNKSLEEFNGLLQQKLQNVEYMASVEQRLKQGALENSDAVKQWADQEKNLDNIRKANTALAEAKKIKQYTDTVKAGQKGTKEYKEAMAALVKEYGDSEDAILANIDAYSALADKGLKGATNAQELLRQSLQQAINDLRATGAAGLKAAADLQVLLGIFNQLGADTTDTSGGGGGTRKKAWETELEMIERVADAEDEYAQQYLDHIDNLLQNDALSSKERQRLEKEREYAVLAGNGELEQAHIEYLERLLRRERLTAEQRLDIEKRLFQAKSALMDQYQDFADAIMSAYTAKLEAQRDAQLAAIQDQISAVQERARKEIDAIRETMDARIDVINAEIRALDDLAKAQDRTGKDEEDNKKLQRLQVQLEYEKDGRNRQKLLEQIAALEKSISERHAQEQLEDQKQALRDQQEAIRDEAENQIKIIQEQADREQAALNRRYAAAQKYWENRLQLENVQQEALQFLIDASQQEIIALLEEYAPEYLAKGQLLGSQFYGGLKPKIDACIAEIERLRAEAAKPIVITTIHRTVYETVGSPSRKSENVTTSIASFAAAPGPAVSRMFSNMQQAVNGVAYRSIHPAAMAAQAAIGASTGRSAVQTRNVKVEQKVILQQPVPTPYQTARALRRESERLAKLI